MASLVLSVLSARCCGMGLISIAVDPENKRLMSLGFKDSCCSKCSVKATPPGFDCWPAT